MAITLADRIFFYLIGLPCALGGLLGILRNRTCSVIIVGFSAIVLILSIMLLDSQLPISLDARIIMILTVLCWATFGIFTGYQSLRYLQFLGPLGYMFSLGLKIVGVCLSAIFIEGPLKQFLNGESLNIWHPLGLYGPFLGMGIAFLFPLGPRLTLVAFKTALKDLFSIFAVFSLLNFLAEFFWQDFISNLLWRIPGTTPPDSYEVFFNLAVAISITVRLYDPAAVFSSNPRVDAITGLLIVLIQEDAIDKPTPVPISLTPFTYQLPEGWVIDQNLHEKAEYRFLARPPNGRLSRLDLLIFQYSESTISDQEKLRTRTYINLHDATIVEDKITWRHGVMSHECLYKQGNVYGFVVHFIIHSNEFVIRWFSSDGRIFRQYRPEIEKFIDSIEFDAFSKEKT